VPVTRSAANSNTFKVTTPSDCEILITRLFDAPLPLVFEAMNRPEHIRNWWGQLGDGYSVPVCEVDFRVGGKWKFVNQIPSGEQVTFYGEYKEIDAPKRVVYTEIFAPFPDEPSLCTATLAEEKGKTRLTVVARYNSRQTRDMVIGTGMEKGAAISYDRLEEVAARLMG